MAETELERAEKRVAQAQARLSAIKSRASAKQRKLDTRRKIILGGALLEKAENGDETMKELIHSIIKGLSRKADVSAFSDWSMKDE